MELTIESALSPGGFVGHFSYFLLIVSMMMRRMWLLRLIVISSALVSILYDAVWVKDPVGVFWETLLIAVNVVQLTLFHLENVRARFSVEETEFVTTKFPALPAALQRKLLNHGAWRDSAEGDILTLEGAPVRELVYVSKGKIAITSHDVVVAKCEEGAYIGEMTSLTGTNANGTAITAEPSRIWAIDAQILRNLVKKEPLIGQALEASFAQNLREKLVNSNRFILDSVPNQTDRLN